MEQVNVISIKNLLQELNERKLTINNAKNLIQTEQYKIKKLQDTEFSFSIQSLIEEIAKEWNVNVEDLNIHLKTYQTKQVGKFTKDEFVEMFENNFSNSANLQLEITIKFKENKFYTCLPINFHDIQKDGRQLRDCIDIYTERILGLGYITDFDFSDYKNFIFKLKYKYAFDFINCKPINKNCELYFKAQERDIRKIKENVTNINI